MSFPRYPQYKESGEEWLGEVPEHWAVQPLKRQFQLVGGSTPKSDNGDFWDGDILWVTPADISNRNSLLVSKTQRTITSTGLASCGTTLVPAGSLILSTRAPIGSLAIATVGLCTNQGCKSLVPLRDADTRYFAYLLGINSAELNKRGKGTTFLELSGDELGAFRSPVPPHREQRAIVKFLDHETAKIDALIANQHRLIELLKEKRQAVISHAVTRGLNPDVPMKPSAVEWLGEVPAHWSVLPLKSLVRMCGRIGYRGYSTTDIVSEGEGAIALSPSNMAGGQLTLDKCTYVSWEKYRESPEIMVSTGDVLMVKTGSTLGKVAFVEELPHPATINPQILVLKQAQCDPQFLYFALTTPSVQSAILVSNSGSTIPTISQEAVGCIRLPVPSPAEQAEIVESIICKAHQFEILILASTGAIALLQERRTALISAAVTGKIDVRGFEESAAWNTRQPQPAFRA